MKWRVTALLVISLLGLAIAVPANILVVNEPSGSVPAQQPLPAPPPWPSSPEETALREKFVLLTEEEFVVQAFVEIFSEYAGGIGRILRSFSTYEEYARDYERSLYLREKAIALIATLMQDKEIGHVLTDLIASHITRLAIINHLPDGIVAVANTRTGLVVFNARVFDEAREDRDWLVLYGLVHEAVHLMYPNETGPKAHARIHDSTLQMLEPAADRYPDDYDKHRFLVDVALADVPEVSRLVRESFENRGSSEISGYYVHQLHELREKRQRDDPGQVFRYAGMSYDAVTNIIEISWR